MTCLIQWGHKLCKNSKSVENHIFRVHLAPRLHTMAGRTQLVATLRYSNTCRNHYPELLVLGVVTTDAEAPVYNPGILKFLPGFMTRLWGRLILEVG